MPRGTDVLATDFLLSPDEPPCKKYKETLGYREMREKNNRSVRKSRAKKAKEVAALKDKVSSFKKENRSLQNKVAVLEKEIEMLNRLLKEHQHSHDCTDVNARIKSYVGFFNDRTMADMRAELHRELQDEQLNDSFSPQ